MLLLLFSCYVGLVANLWTVACQAPLSMQFPKQEYWSKLPFPTPRDLIDPGIKCVSPALTGEFLATVPPENPIFIHIQLYLKNKVIVSLKLIVQDTNVCHTGIGNFNRYSVLQILCFICLSCWTISFCKVRDMQAHLSGKEYDDWPGGAI